MLALGLALALLSTLVLDVGYLLQQRSADVLERIAIRHPVAAARRFLGSPGWLVGVELSVVGWLLYLAALALADISLVQSVSAGGVALLAVIAALWFGARLSRVEWAGVAVATAGLVLLGLSLIGHDPDAGCDVNDLGVAVWIGASAVAGLVLAIPRLPLPVSAAALGGLAAGVLFGAGDVASKAFLEGLPGSPGVADVLAEPYLYAMLGVYAIGFGVQQMAFQRGEAVTTIGLMVAATNALPIAAGLVVFDDPLPDTPAGLAARFGAFALVIIGSALLARVSEGGEPR